MNNEQHHTSPVPATKHVAVGGHEPRPQPQPQPQPQQHQRARSQRQASAPTQRPVHLHVNGADTGIALCLAHTWGQRARGLLGRAPLGHLVAVWLRPCAAVHTFGMGYRLDLVFLDADGKVLRLVHSLRPFSWAACPRASSVLEFRAGVAVQHRWQVGDRMHASVVGPRPPLDQEPRQAPFQGGEG